MSRDRIQRPTEFVEGIYLAHATTTLTGAATLTVSSPMIQYLDPGGADRNVTLPALAASDGLEFHIHNAANGLENLQVKNAGATNIVKIGPNQSARLTCDGSSWKFTLSAFAVAIRAASLTGEETLTLVAGQVHHLDPGGADRDVLLPTEASAIGVPITIKNTADADEKLTVKEDTDTTAQAILGAGQTGVFTSDGTAWHVGFPGDTTGAVNIETLGATHVLTATSPKFQTLDPGGGARDVTLPVAAIALTALEFRIANAADAAEALTVKDGVSTIAVIDQDEIGVFWCDGATWQGGSMPEA
ncbi:MAG: hypothetical protein GY937_22835 [bacterium]|nr:hypothetical protein [bacterium]